MNVLKSKWNNWKDMLVMYLIYKFYGEDEGDFFYCLVIEEKKNFKELRKFLRYMENKYKRC
jgi:hypothetical protein